MKWQLTVSEKLGSWGAAGKVYKPGVHIVEDARLVEAVKRAPAGVSLKEMPEEAKPGVVEEFKPPAPTGTLTVADITPPAGGGKAAASDARKARK